MPANGTGRQAAAEGTARGNARPPTARAAIESTDGENAMPANGAGTQAIAEGIARGNARPPMARAANETTTGENAMPANGARTQAAAEGTARGNACPARRDRNPAGDCMDFPNRCRGGMACASRLCDIISLHRATDVNARPHGCTERVRGRRAIGNGMGVQRSIGQRQRSPRRGEDNRQPPRRPSSGCRHLLPVNGEKRAFITAFANHGRWKGMWRRGRHPFSPFTGVRRTGRDPWLDPGRCPKGG